ncbi:hypothetical protein PFUGPA_02512 [Plasmodium falciparum Palo Alto/Uganda]|uniref:Uncharacterized protein n=1 Tax=Plasmodium falciparum (isolate Palo Alto / Uganda) TaxID=57270 RepID=W4IZX0_PLAFP|nr:hypothetical protein PFUGPA_02512 [Plasmodium falciparum Palo Alto/Uganda]
MLYFNLSNMNMSKKRLNKNNVNYKFEFINLFDKNGKNKRKITSWKFCKSLILTTLGMLYIFLLKLLDLESRMKINLDDLVKHPWWFYDE